VHHRRNEWRWRGVDRPCGAAMRRRSGRWQQDATLLKKGRPSRREIMSTTVLRLARTAVLIPVLAAGLGLLAGCGINNIPSYEETAKARWSQVLNEYQRRADLIPNLVETVKGYAAQERQVLEAVTNARARATQMQIPPDIVTNPEAFKRFQEAQAQLTGALGRLLAVS